MVKDGRTMREAIGAGNYFSLEVPGWIAGYAPPAAETKEEVLACFRERFPGQVRAGLEFRVLRIVGGSIGCRVVEDAGTVAAK
jgi:hypothetical protein